LDESSPFNRVRRQPFVDKKEGGGVNQSRVACKLARSCVVFLAGEEEGLTYISNLAKLYRQHCRKQFLTAFYFFT